jgi:hypothetical protein
MRRTMIIQAGGERAATAAARRLLLAEGAAAGTGRGSGGAAGLDLADAAWGRRPLASRPRRRPFPRPRSLPCSRPLIRLPPRRPRRAPRRPHPAVSGFTLFGTRMSLRRRARLGHHRRRGRCAEQLCRRRRGRTGGAAAVGRVRLRAARRQRLGATASDGRRRSARAAASPATGSSTGLALTPAAIRNNVALAPRMIAGRVSGFLVSATGNPRFLPAPAFATATSSPRSTAALDRSRRPAIAAQPRRPPLAHR